MKTFLALFVILVLPRVVFGQLYNSYFFVTWNPEAPLVTDDFRNGISLRGLYGGYHQFLNDNASIGFEASSTVFDHYLPRATYPFSGGAITTDFHNYMQVVGVLLAGNYFFRTEGRVVPYMGLGLGAGFTILRQYYGVYSDSGKKAGFMARPSGGILFRAHDYSRYGLKAGIHVDYAGTAADGWGNKNLIAIGFLVGIAVLND